VHGYSGRCRDMQLPLPSAVWERTKCRKSAPNVKEAPVALYNGAANLGRCSSGLWASGALVRKPRLYAA
jgi:hypothetical protein